MILYLYAPVEHKAKLSDHMEQAIIASSVGGLMLSVVSTASTIYIHDGHNKMVLYTELGGYRIMLTALLGRKETGEKGDRNTLIETPPII